MIRPALVGALMALVASTAVAQTHRDSSGTVVQAVATSGSTGIDASANKPALPNVGSAFGASGPYANYVQVKAIDASAARINIDIENTSGAQIAVVIDDGTATVGAAPVNATVFALGGGSGVGAQGGSWASATERGRVQIYAPSASAFVAVRLN